MRLLGTLPDESHARRLADYLLTLGIGTRVNQEGPAWEVWVRDDDHVARARQEWEPFRANPDDPRFQQAQRAAQSLKQQEAAAEQEYRRNQRRASDLWTAPGLRKAPLTLGLIALCVLVAVLTHYAQVESPVTLALTFTSIQISPRDPDFIVPLIQQVPEGYDPWIEGLRQGELWRLLTPMLLHFSFWHLLLNMLALVQLGLMIEARKGTWWLLGMVLFISVASNFAQYFLPPWFALHVMQGAAVEPSLLFGGMSGVIFGLFGYLWMKVQYDPEPGLFLDRQSVILMLGWLVLCMTGTIGPIANTAHVVGLLTGMAIGLGRVAWRRLRQR